MFLPIFVGLTSRASTDVVLQMQSVSLMVDKGGLPYALSLCAGVFLTAIPSLFLRPDSLPVFRNVASCQFIGICAVVPAGRKSPATKALPHVDSFTWSEAHNPLGKKTEPMLQCMLPTSFSELRTGFVLLLSPSGSSRWL
jgi:hypothetical protein